MRFGTITALLLSCTLMLCGGCGVTVSNGNESSLADSSADSSGKTKLTGLFYTWSGEVLTPENAEKNGCIFLGNDTANSRDKWGVFSNTIAYGNNAELTVCTEKSITAVNTISIDGNEIAQIKIKELQDGVILSRGLVVSPAVIGSAEADGVKKYFIGDTVIYTEPAEGGPSAVPAELNSFEVDPDAVLTFPYSKIFSSADDFDSYYSDFDSTLGLGEVKAYIEGLEADGGFNTNVVFLYGDMATADGVEYRLINAVCGGGELTIYVHKSAPAQKGGSISKWQLMCTVPSQYLSEIDPESITWVVYDEYETRG